MTQTKRKRPNRSRSKTRGVALVLVDVINAFDFPGAGPLIKAAHKVAPNIHRMAERARECGVPVIYVNDNFGRWRSDFKATVQACTAPDLPGRLVCELLRPQPDDYFVLKPQHSGFYSTTLDLMLKHLGAHVLVLAGFAANLCLVFTANDAHMRGYRVVAPSDCTAANSPALTRGALDHMKSALSADIRPSSRLSFPQLSKISRRSGVSF